MPGAWRRISGALLCACATVTVAACGSSSSKPATSGGAGTATPAAAASTSSASSPAGSCGTATFKSPQDPDHVFASLPAATKQVFNGYEYPVYKSRWAHWKPSGKVSVGVSAGQPVNSFQADVLSSFEAKLKAMPQVGKVTVLGSATANNVPAQIQQYETLVQQKPDIIILFTDAGQPFAPLAAKAAAEGIPTVSALATVDTPDAVSVVPNTYLAALQTTESIVKQVGGKGSALIVQGIPGISINTDGLNGIHAVLRNCPHIKTVGMITGQYQPSVVKAQALSFLGTHPQPIDLALGIGGAADGVIGAFQSTGRSLPAVTDQSIDEGMAGFWLEHKSTLKASISGGGANAFAQLLGMVVGKIVAGDGIKVSSVVQPQPVITPANIGQWAKSSWKLGNSATDPDPDGAFDNAALVGPLFAK